MEMNKKEKNTKKRLYILKGMKNVLICDGIAIVVLVLIATIYSFFKHAYIMKSIYMSFYYGGAAALLIGIPQFYKRNEDTKIRKLRRHNPMFGFYDWFGQSSYDDQAMEESFEQFKGEGFWLGMMILFFSLILFAIAITLENIFFIYK